MVDRKDPLTWSAASEDFPTPTHHRVAHLVVAFDVRHIRDTVRLDISSTREHLGKTKGGESTFGGFRAAAGDFASHPASSRSGRSSGDSAGTYAGRLFHDGGKS
jgi:hypothetical protein